jgi:hypothetical protein
MACCRGTRNAACIIWRCPLSSGIDLEIHVDIDTSRLLREFETRAKAAQVFLDSEVMRTSEQFVPFDTGMLARSAQLATKPGSGAVVWDTPYAHRQYFADNADFATDKHPKARARWADAAKAVYLNDWMAGVEQILKEGNR